MLRKIGSIIGAIAMALTLLMAASSPAPATGKNDRHRHGTVFPFRAEGWSYLDVANGAFPAFPSPGPYDSAFLEGQGGFGTIGHGCSFNSPGRVRSYWKPGTDLLLRRSFGLAGLDPTQGSNDDVVFTGTIQGSADIYYDGEFITHVQGTNCQRNNVRVRVTPHGNFGRLDVRASSADPDGPVFIDLKAVVYYTQYGCEDC